MIYKMKVIGIFCVVFALAFGLNFMPEVNASRAVDYTLDISDPTGDVDGDNFGGDIVTDADITSVQSSENNGTITLELTVAGTIHGISTSGLNYYLYDFIIDVNGDGIEDWGLYIIPDPVFESEFYATLEDDEYNYNYELAGNDVFGDGLKTLTAKFPISYITDPITAWDLYAETYIYNDLEDAFDTAPDGEFSFDAYGDDDSDGMENWWEKTYGLNYTDASDADLDPDSDGFTNLQEYKYSTNPKDENSKPPSLSNNVIINITYPYSYETISSSEDYYDYYTAEGTSQPPSGDTIKHIEWRAVEAMGDWWEPCSDVSSSSDWSSWEAYIPTYAVEGYGFLEAGYNTFQVRVVTNNNFHNLANVTIYFDTSGSSALEEYEYWTLSFTSKTVDIAGPFDVWYIGTYKLNTETYPKQIDIKITDNSEDTYYNGLTCLGIYELYEDILFISVNEPGVNKRPMTYDDEGANTVFYLVLDSTSSNPGTEIEGVWVGTAASYFDYLDDAIYEWDEFFEPYPFTKTPTDTSIGVQITSATLSFQVQWDRDSFYILVKGATSGVDHCKITFISFYKDGTHDAEAYWEEEVDMKEFDNEIKKYMAEYGIETWHFKATTENWTTWEYKLNSTFTYDELNITDFDALDISELEEIYDYILPVKLEIYVRAYSDINETKWNQDKYEVVIDRSTKGNTINIDFVGESRAKIEFDGDGNSEIMPIQDEFLIAEKITESTFGETYEPIGQFVKIEMPEGSELNWMNIVFEYDPAKLPAGVLEDELNLYYFDGTEWVLCEKTGVDKENHLIYANVTHLTIFAPMAESSSGGGGGGGGPDGDGDAGDTDGTAGINITIIAALIAVVFVIALAAGVIIVRKRKPPMQAPPPPPAAEPESETAAEEKAEKEEEMKEDEMKEEDLVEPEWEEDEGPIDLSPLETITKNCPNCKTGIDVEPSFDDKISLKCPSCGSKGRIPNPYKDDIEKLRKDKDKESEESFDDFEIEL